MEQLVEPLLLDRLEQQQLDAQQVLVLGKSATSEQHTEYVAAQYSSDDLQQSQPERQQSHAQELHSLQQGSMTEQGAQARASPNRDGARDGVQERTTHGTRGQHVRHSGRVCGCGQDSDASRCPAPWCGTKDGG